MTGEREVKMAAGLYAMRDTARQVLGSKYTAKMAELGAVLKAVGEKSGRGPLAVAIDAANGASAMEQCCLLAAAVELAEPTQ